MFGTVEVGQHRDARAFQGTPPEVLGSLKLPGGNRGQREYGAGRGRGPQREPGARQRSRTIGSAPCGRRARPTRGHVFLEVQARVANVTEAALRILLEAPLEQLRGTRMRLC